MTKIHKKWHDVNFHQFFALAQTSNLPIQVEEKLEWSENEKRDKPREPSQKIIEKLARAGTSQQFFGNKFDLGVTDRFPLLVCNLKLLVWVEKKLELDASQECCTLY